LLPSKAATVRSQKQVGWQAKAPAPLFGILLLLIVAAFPVAAQSDARAKELCAEIQPIAVELTQVSGMPLKHPVPCDYITKQKINDFLNSA